MRRHALATLMILCVSAVFSLPAAAWEFAADFKQSHSWAEEGEKEQTGKIFVKADKSRIEFVRGGQLDGIMIVNPEKGAAWMLDPAEKTYMEVPFSEDLYRMAQSAEAGHPDLVQTQLGQESVQGYVCDKVSFTYKDAAFGNTVVWLSKKLEYPLKWENKSPQGTSWFQLANIREGKLKESLFEIPAGYKALSMGEDEDAQEGEAAAAIKQDAKDLAGDAHGAAKQGVSDVVTDSIRKGIEGLFKK